MINTVRNKKNCVNNWSNKGTVKVLLCSTWTSRQSNGFADGSSGCQWRRDQCRVTLSEAAAYRWGIGCGGLGGRRGEETQTESEYYGALLRRNVCLNYTNDPWGTAVGHAHHLQTPGATIGRVFTFPVSYWRVGAGCGVVVRRCRVLRHLAAQRRAVAFWWRRTEKFPFASRSHSHCVSIATGMEQNLHMAVKKLMETAKLVKKKILSNTAEGFWRSHIMYPCWRRLEKVSRKDFCLHLRAAGCDVRHHVSRLLTSENVTWWLDGEEDE